EPGVLSNRSRCGGGGEFISMHSDAKNNTAPEIRPRHAVYLPAEYLSQIESDDDKIDLREVLSALWRQKWTILLFTVVSAMVSVVVALRRPNIDQADDVLAPTATEERSGGQANIASQFGGMASIAGISLGGNAIDKTTLALEILQSRAFLTDFIRRNNIII